MQMAFRQQLLQPAVLVFERLEFAGVRHLHPAVARSPLVERRVADAILAAHFAGRQPSAVLLQNLGDLLFCESALTHVRLPKNGLYPKSRAFRGSRSTGSNSINAPLLSFRATSNNIVRAK
jgi:hypothetical protein